MVGTSATLPRVNPLAKLSLYLVAVVLLAALLSPPLYAALQGVFEGVPFHRFFNRVVLVVALALLWPALRWMNIRGMSELGLVKNPRAVRDLATGLALALLPLLVLAVVYFGFDIYRVKKEIPWANIFKIAATVAFVPVVEEALFRGVLLGISVRSLGRWAGAVLVSAVFAVVHFIRQHGEATDVHWWSGFALLGSVFPGADDMPETLAGAANLFVIGLILAAAALRTCSLWLPIGLHAGWVLGQQLINLVGKYRVKPTPDALLPWWGRMS